MAKVVDKNKLTIDEWSFYEAYPLHQQIRAQLQIWEVEDHDKLLRLIMMSVRQFAEKAERTNG